MLVQDAARRKWLVLLFCMCAGGIVLTSARTPAQPLARVAQSFDCLLEPDLRLKLATPVAGVLKHVVVDRGDAVRTGQVIAQLESAIEEANVELSAARAENDAAVKGRQARLDFV